MKRAPVLLSLTVALFYAALAMGAAGCQFLHPDSPFHSRHQSNSHVAHSAICAWACQVNPSAALVPVIPSVTLLFMLSRVLPLLRTPYISFASPVRLSRGPPLVAR
ncbi:hypothetical protein W02_29030 [Nitrospira sp. KM1]|uniref:hypothetical protein n=1 Tax=Nitrospira sp. KM1 TaxID=1936990 RepID=UPI0013A76883|nr:hypothetical protein [Nitrospira sp. KM1]BCA55763.1 hypothetical protein W02_29030 [Nitrospira sp. KM1]